MFCDENHRETGTTEQGHLLLDYLLPGQPLTDPGVAFMLGGTQLNRVSKIDYFFGLFCIFNEPSEYCAQPI